MGSVSRAHAAIQTRYAPTTTVVKTDVAEPAAIVQQTIIVKPAPANPMPPVATTVFRGRNVLGITARTPQTPIRPQTAKRYRPIATGYRRLDAAWAA